MMVGRKLMFEEEGVYLSLAVRLRKRFDQAGPDSA